MMSLLRLGSVNSNRPPVRWESMSITPSSNQRSVVASMLPNTAAVKAE